MLFTELKKHILSRKLEPAYLITGEDAFLIGGALKFFRSLCPNMPDFNLCELSAPASVSVISEACESLPIGDDYRVVTVIQCKTDLSGLIKYLDSPNPTTVLVFVAEKPESNLSKIMSRLTIVDCSKLDRRTMLSWIAAKTKELSSGITESAANLLIDYCGGDMSRIASEHAKLCAYRTDGIIGDDDVISLTEPTLDFKIFELSEAVASKQPKKAAMVLKNLSESGASPISLIGMLYSHFRRLLYVAITPQYERMASDLGVKEYAVKKAKEQAMRFTPVKLKRICDNLTAADYNIKSGKMLDKNALELVVFKALSI